MNTKTTSNGRICSAPSVVRTRRIALFLDLENLLHEPLATGDLDAAIRDLRLAVQRFRARGTIVTAVASVNHHLWPAIAFEASALGIRVHCHCGGRDAADHDLLRRIDRELPASVDTVVIGSGDHIFAPVARRLKAAGYAVEVLARFGHLSRDLYVASSRYHMIGVA